MWFVIGPTIVPWGTPYIPRFLTSLHRLASVLIVCISVSMSKLVVFVLVFVRYFKRFMMHKCCKHAS